MSKGVLPCKRFLNGRTEFRSLAQLLVILKKTARDRTVQREAVWLHIKDKCSKYISNVTVGYGKAALLHLIELKPTIVYLKSIAKSSEDYRYIAHLEKFVKQGYEYLHVDGGNRSDTILAWYGQLESSILESLAPDRRNENSPLKLQKAIYPLGKFEAGIYVKEGYITLDRPWSRQELIDQGGEHKKLADQIDNMTLSIEVYTELTEEDRRDLFYNLNDNEEVTAEEKRNCETSTICNEIRNFNDKHKAYFRDNGWVTKDNTLRYKFCAWIGYLNNFHANGDFSEGMKSWVPATLDADYKHNSPAEQNLPKFFNYFEKQFLPLAKIITESESHRVDPVTNKRTKIPQKELFKNLGQHRNQLIDLHMILTRLDKTGKELQKDNKRSYKTSLKKLYKLYQDWFAVKNDGNRDYQTNGDQMGTWSDLYSANTFPKVKPRLNGIIDEFMPILENSGIVVTVETKATFDENWRMPLLSDQKNICALSGKYISPQDAANASVTELDHIIPRNKGGLTVYENCQLVYKSANRKKSDKLEE